MPSIKINPPVIAHRGASVYAPENTLASFLKAKELGVRWLEFDVMLTADAEVVVIHDDTIDRTTNGKGNVVEHSYSFLKKLDAGTWFHPNFSEEKIPLFADVIEFLYQHQLAANVEIKALPGKEEITVKKVLEVISQHWRQEMTPPLISSFSLSVLRAVRMLSASSQVALLMHEWLPNWQEICDKLQCMSVNVNEKILTSERVKKIQSTDRVVLSYTVNDVKRAAELFSWGVDAVFSDCPDKILKELHLIRGKQDGKL